MSLSRCLHPLVFFALGGFTLASSCGAEDLLATAQAAYAQRDWETVAAKADAALLEARILRGFARGRLGNHAGSLADFAGALATDPENAEALYGKARTLRFMKAYEGALPYAQKATEQDGDIGRYWIERGIITFFLQDFAATRTSFEAAYAAEPDMRGVNAFLAEVYLYVGEYTLALNAAERGQAKEPDLGIHRVNIAHAHLFLDDWATAQTYYQKCADELDMDNTTPIRQVVATDFERMRAAGIVHPRMNDVLTLLEAYTSGS